MRLRCIAASTILLASTAALHAESKNPADYPLRIHVFPHAQTAFYHNRSAEEFKGDGRADLFQNGEAHAVDFTYDCSEKLRASLSYETYPAKWKKPNQQLTILLPVFGKSNTYAPCTIKTDVKDFAYATHDGIMSETSSAKYKTWMNRHDYDPEHGKNTPTNLSAQSAAPAPSAASTAPAPNR